MELEYNTHEDGCFYKVYEGDCLNMEEVVDSNEVDLVVTSPPYNIGKEYEDVVDTEEYLNFTEEWTSLVNEVTKEDGSFWLNIGFRKESDGYQYIPWEYEIYPLIKEHTSFSLVQQVIWHYKAGVNCRNRFSPRKETWLYYVNDLDNYTFNLDDVRVPHKYPNQSKNGELKVNPKGKNPGDVWDIKKVTSGSGRSADERTNHPAQYPEEVIERIIKVSSNEGDVILDPFLGSGTTMKVARDLNRSCIGIELEPEYIHDIVYERVFAEYEPPEEEDSEPEQVGLDDVN
jgi:adenine-specific DNA-methyltransferase